MSADPIDLYAENDITFVLAGVKKLDATGKLVNDDTLANITAFIALTNTPTATAANVAFSVTAVSVSGGKYQARFDRTALTYALLHAVVADGAPLYLIWDCPGNFRVEQILTYHDSLPAA